MRKEDDNSIILQIIKESKNSISSYLKIDEKQFDDILQYIVIRAKLSGCNNKICIVDFFDNRESFLGDICLKYSSSKKMKFGLITEANILNLLYLNKRICPALLHSGVLKQRDISYIIIEVIRGSSLNYFDLSIKEARIILNIIQFHESILNNNMQTLSLSLTIKSLNQKIDFGKKISMFLFNIIPDFIINDSLNFLNYYLNDKKIKEKRVIVTDRSSENIFQNLNDNIILIDFSTIRVGSQFDNWIQFIDDPRVHFSCRKEDLVKMFFEENNLNVKDLKYFYAASVYTNLLQGIFTYKKNPKLGISYFENANNSFVKLNNKKGMLININYQHALRQN